MPSEPSKLLSVKELALRLRISIATAYELVGSGAISSLRVGPRRGVIRIREEDVDTYLNGCRFSPVEKPRIAPRASLRHIRLKG